MADLLRSPGWRSSVCVCVSVRVPPLPNHFSKISSFLQYFLSSVHIVHNWCRCFLRYRFVTFPCPSFFFFFKPRANVDGRMWRKRLWPDINLWWAANENRLKKDSRQMKHSYECVICSVWQYACISSPALRHCFAYNFHVHKGVSLLPLPNGNVCPCVCVLKWWMP